MPTFFEIRSKETKGYTTLYVRLQSRLHKVNYKMSTGLEVEIPAWNKAKKSATAMNSYHDKNPELWGKLDRLKLTLNALLDGDKAPTKEEMKQAINMVMHAPVQEEKKKAKEAAQKAEEEKKRITIDKYIDDFEKQICNGSRLTNRGTPYSLGTVKAIKTCLKQFKAYEAERKKTYHFEDINFPFYYDFQAYLNKRGYNINSAGKIIKELKAIMAAAEADGIHSNTIYKNPKFRGIRVEVDNIYLTKEELDAMMKADLSQLEPAAEKVRDIFMVGVWTAQRVSDYNNIKKEDIHTKKKHWIEEVPDPDNPGEMMPTIKTKEITFIDITQQKTGAKVSIPCKAELKQILEKYDYNLPHVEDQTINRLIKEVGKAAGITQLVPKETTNGGIKKTELVEKYKLIMSHTARRTGATLMYLAGIDAYDIIKITGHQDLEMLRKYIKADHLDVAEKLSDKYDYFN